MWLSKPLYEGLPFYYIALGAISLVASLFVEQWHWPVVCAVFGVSCVIGGLVLLLKRRDYRSSRSRTAFEDTL